MRQNSSYHDKNQESPTVLAVMDAWEGHSWVWTCSF